MPASGVRLARTPDVDGIAAVNVRSWRQRFAGMLPAEVLDGLDVIERAVIERSLAELERCVAMIGD